MIAFDCRLEEADQRLALASEVSEIHGETAVEPWNTFGVEVGDNAQTQIHGLGAMGFAEQGRRDRAGPEVAEALRPDFLDGDVLAFEAKPAQDQRGRGIAFRSRAADPESSALELRVGLDLWRGEHRGADDVAERADVPQRAAGNIGPNDR